VNAGLTPEMALISSNFAGNKGRLPWPVERGTITGKFGTQPHAALRNVTVENNGIDITTQAGAPVRSIFEGEVVNVIFNPSFQKGIIIKHGEYYSVYTGLTAVQVKAGDKITTKQVIGTAYTGDDNQTEIHLEIWKGTTIMDPAGWITK
jgi:murein DD-endopeptidase MepM/ murein hydrolase activator NlpD